MKATTAVASQSGGSKARKPSSSIASNPPDVVSWLPYVSAPYRGTRNPEESSEKVVPVEDVPPLGDFVLGRRTEVTEMLATREYADELPRLQNENRRFAGASRHEDPAG